MSMQLHVYTRNPTQDERELLRKMLTAGGISDWILHDISAEDLNKAPIVDLGLAIGKVCERAVVGKARTLMSVASFKQLTLNPSNVDARKVAWETVQKLKRILDGKEIGEQKCISWQHALVYLPGNKRMCIYEKDIPTDVEADIFISRTDSNLLLKLKEAFQAESVIIGKE